MIEIIEIISPIISVLGFLFSLFMWRDQRNSKIRQDMADSILIISQLKSDLRVLEEKVNNETKLMDKLYHKLDNIQDTLWENK
jgi:hypothetical protein